MRFKQQNAQIPEVNLIPMLNVMMGILAFFVMITMSLTTEHNVEVALPPTQENPLPQEEQPEPLIVSLEAAGIQLENQPVDPDQLTQQIQLYLANAPDGMVVLQAEPELPYEQVIQLLDAMKAVGGDRVSLSID